MKIISATVGVILLIAAVLLSYLSSTNGEAMLAKKDAKVVEYVTKSKEALKVEDVAGAQKYAKLAIETDPKSYKGFQAYDKVLKFKYKPQETISTPVVENTQPSYQEEDDDEDEEDDSGVIQVEMGC